MDIIFWVAVQKNGKLIFILVEKYFIIVSLCKKIFKRSTIQRK